MANAYESAAMSYALSNGWSSADAETTTYPEIAQAAGVTLGPGDTSPDDFFYRHVQQHVVRELAKAEKALAKAAKKAKVQVKIKDVEGFEDITSDNIVWLDAGESEAVDGPACIIHPSTEGGTT